MSNSQIFLTFSRLLDNDECEGEGDGSDCATNANCTNTEGSYECNCGKGYQGDGTTCDDKDECENDKSCSVNEYCKNNVGSYSCLCVTGYERNEDDECESEYSWVTARINWPIAQLADCSTSRFYLTSELILTEDVWFGYVIIPTDELKPNTINWNRSIAQSVNWAVGLLNGTQCCCYVDVITVISSVIAISELHFVTFKFQQMLFLKDQRMGTIIILQKRWLERENLSVFDTSMQLQVRIFG